METIYIILYISLGINVTFIFNYLEEFYKEPPFLYLLTILFFPFILIGILIKWLSGGYK